ncbi:hypothetical protein LIA77_09008 [Sarocladium implicatum]|nr:hypothetical protein LIA77_09008 [Sarocladium implicatum]
MKQTTFIAGLGLLRAASAAEGDVDDWTPLLKNPNATATRGFKGYNISQAYPGEALDGWEAYIKIRADLPHEGSEGNEYKAIMSWIGVSPPDDIVRTGDSGEDAQQIEADDSWDGCISGFAFYSPKDDIDEDCGNVLSECMDYVKKTAKAGKFCEAARNLDWQRTENGPANDCNFEEGVSRFFYSDDPSFQLSNRTVGGLNVTAPYDLIGVGDKDLYRRWSELVYFVSVDWTRNGNGTSSRSDGKSDQIESSYVCMRPDTFNGGDDEGAASTRSFSLLMVVSIAAAVVVF